MGRTDAQAYRMDRRDRRFTLAIQHARHTNGLSRCIQPFGDGRATITLSEPWKGVWAIDCRFSDPVRLGVAREQLQRLHPDARIRLWVRRDAFDSWREVLPRKNHR